MSEQKPVSDGQVNSPERINPKKPKQKAAHNITLSKVIGSADHDCNIPVSSSGVMGMRMRLRPVGFPLRMPFNA